MNPLARLLAARGETVQGSDRSLDQGQNQAVAAVLAAAGVRLVPQDGSAIDAGIDRFVHSTAVENETAEMRAARHLGLACQARPALLAEILAGGEPAVAVTGTSGKSSVVAMIGWILERLHLPATVVGGAALAEAGASHMGHLRCGPLKAPVVVEACESDRAVAGYRSHLAVLLNVGRDHADADELHARLRAFLAHAERIVVGVDGAAARALAEQAPGTVRGVGRTTGDDRLDTIRAGPHRAQGELHLADGTTVFLDLPQPGDYSLDNAAIAVVVAAELGADPAAAAAALADFPGIARRYQRVGTSDDGIWVVDDYAHNPDKLAAVLAAATGEADRVHCIFQPHGFAPARFMRPWLPAVFANGLRPDDGLCLAPIYDAGGTTERSLTSLDLAADIARRRPCEAVDSHAAVLAWATERAAPGDLVLLCGARDPRLPGLARALLDLL